MKRLVYGTSIAAIAMLFFSCGSTPKKEAPVPVVEPAYEANPSDAVSIAVPSRKKRSYFDGIPEQILANVEIGSPDTLKTAISQLKKPSDTATEQEKILQSVATHVLQIVWGLESTQTTPPEVSDANPYLGAIATARQGVYDSSTGKTDFLTTVLPSLVLVTSEIRNDYYEQSLADLQAALQERKDSVLANYLLGVL
ncbi:MAG: hypothetical protein IJS09_03460, partial [Treponema sp.]|nr:hypothetical protein [Treponema sp.]